MASKAPARRPRRWWRILKRMMIALGVIVIVLVFGVFPYWVAGLATGAKTRPADRLLTETPATFGAEYKDVEFQTSDGVRISGWLLASRDRRATIIYSHGLFRSRRELLPRAIDLWRLGYGALLYDSRNHGSSGPARVSLGYHERLDAAAAVRFLREEERIEDRIVLFGISMGAAAALLAAAETPEVAAVISDSSFISFKDTIDHHIRMFLRLPPFPLANEVRFFIEQRADFDGSKLDLIDAVRRIGERPVLFINGANDRRMPPELARKLYEASASPKKDLFIVDGPGTEVHGHAYQAAPAAYVEKVDSFLRSAL
ncbi:MAG TPA: alpha/beta fold hydrolase [Blastocatellia bacterium]|nr:alpha/beta fold hydrolase [Blastocatellia bacterium]